MHRLAVHTGLTVSVDIELKFFYLTGCFVDVLARPSGDRRQTCNTGELI
jgi:hypothetical protein